MSNKSTHFLNYEDAWRRTISKQDKERIDQLFKTSVLPEDGVIGFLPIRLARNYKGELLASVIVQNHTSDDLQFQGVSLQLHISDKIMAMEVFDYPNLTIQANSSTPWTFIFPSSAQEDSLNPVINEAEWRVVMPV